jgi:hypothetical protein
MDENDLREYSEDEKDDFPTREVLIVSMILFWEPISMSISRTVCSFSLSIHLFDGG